MTVKHCPVCGEENKCMAGGEEKNTCWCYMEEGFPKGIFDLVPQESKGKHCICKKCVDTYREEVGIKK
ncbi:cysteine-rich CWC family protein [Viridibacillus sp. NPDC096237]|uniref:cysteine-rich CWC family protein n=1 Tax=Viridibacillus sp. NPDC096237 TaxID=3390721 RepID=UPI003D03DC9A